MRRSQLARPLTAALLTAFGLVAKADAQPTVSFTRAQAEHGRSLYAQHCAACHGATLTGGSASPLAGKDFEARWSQPARTLDDLHNVMRTTMPFGAGGSLASGEYLAILAYILEQNGQAAGERALVGDRATLASARVVAKVKGGNTRSVTYPNPEYMTGPRGLVPTAKGPTTAQLLSAESDGRNWLTHTRDYAGSRYSPLSQITTSNVSRLRVACTFQVGVPASFQTGPVVYDETMYLTAGYSTFALDAATCRPKWRHDWQGAVPANLANRGVAIKDGRVVRGTNDGYLLALDAATGALLWARRAANVAEGELFTMPPLIYDDLIFIGPAGSELGMRGWVAAYRLSDGEQVWRFNIVPGAGEPGIETWTHTESIPVAGGAVWTPLSIDAARGLLYVPSANPAPDLPVAIRGGTNLYTNSLIALNIKDGTLAWYEQMVPLDDHDWDLTQVSPLYRATVKGKARDLVATVGKDGILRVVDRTTHERMFETPVTTIDNVDAPVTPLGTHACPGILGGVEWNGPTYHPGANVLVVPAVDWCATYTLADMTNFVASKDWIGGTFTLDEKQQGWVTAVDAATGRVRWRYRSSRPVVGAVTATAGGLIFAGELTGDLIALDAATGVVKHRQFTGGQVGGGIVTYAVAGKQYIAVASGTASRFWADPFPGSPTITVLALDGGR